MKGIKPPFFFFLGSQHKFSRTTLEFLEAQMDFFLISQTTFFLPTMTYKCILCNIYVYMYSMYDRVNDKGLFKGCQTVLPATDKKKSPPYLFVWLPMEEAGLLATDGPFCGCRDEHFAASPPITTSEPIVGIPQPARWWKQMVRCPDMFWCF